MIDMEKIIKKTGGDVGIYKAMKSLDHLSFHTSQSILACVGRNVLQDIVDGTEITNDLIKKHLEGAMKFYKEVA